MTAKPNSKSKSKIKDFELDEKFQEKYPEFTRIYTMGKNLVLEHFKAGLIISKYYSDDITKTISTLKQTFLEDGRITIEFTDDTVDQFLRDFAQLLGRRILEDEQEAKEEEAQVIEEQQQRNSLQEEIKQLKEQHQSITSEEWARILQDKYRNLCDVVEKEMPEIWEGLEFELSVHKILNIKVANTLPFIGIILGRPSSYKTVIIELLKELA